MTKAALSSGFVLPSLDASGALAMARTLETTAGAVSGLAPPILSNLAAMRQDREALEHELGLIAVSPAEIKTAHHEEGLPIRALFGILGGWALLEDRLPEAEAAEVLQEHLFPEGIGFINLPAKQEWALIESKLKSVEEHKLEPAFQQLGLAPLLAHLRKVHAHFGEVTGTTKPAEQGDSPKVRAALLDLITSIRHYGSAVVGSVERRKPETAALAESLLEPITSWRATQRPRKKPSPVAPTTPPAPAAPAAPADPKT
jgi:hypothetical protein